MTDEDFKLINMFMDNYNTLWNDINIKYIGCDGRGLKYIYNNKELFMPLTHSLDDMNRNMLLNYWCDELREDIKKCLLKRL